MARKGKKFLSASAKVQYSNYKLSRSWEKNKKRKLTKHVKNFPEDFQAAKALESLRKIGGTYKRRKRANGLQLTEKQHDIIGVSGRLTRESLLTLRMLTNPQSLRIDKSVNPDLVRKKLRDIKLRKAGRKPTIMSEAFDKSGYIRGYYG